MRKGSNCGPKGTSRSIRGRNTLFPAFFSRSVMTTSRSSIGYLTGPLGFGFESGNAGVGVFASESEALWCQTLIKEKTNDKKYEPASSPFFRRLETVPSASSLSSQTFFRFSFSPALAPSIARRMSSGISVATPCCSAMTRFTVQGDATAASRSTQSRMNRRRIDLLKDKRSRLSQAGQLPAYTEMG